MVKGLLKKIASTLLVEEKHEWQDLATYRIGKCEGCPHFKQDTRQCGICLCFMDEKVKATTHNNLAKGRQEITHCPIGSWNDAHIANMYRKIDGEPLILFNPEEIVPDPK